MSTASRLAAADTRILPPKDPATGRFVKRPDPADLGPQLGKNRAQVPGGLWADPLPGFITVGKQTWSPEDAEPHCVPIGYQLAVEMHLNGMTS